MSSRLFAEERAQQLERELGPRRGTDTHHPGGREVALAGDLAAPLGVGAQHLTVAPLAFDHALAGRKGLIE